MAPEARYSALWQLFMVRVRVFLREPAALFWTFGFPIVIAVALGIAFRSKGPDKLRIAVESSGDGAAADKLHRALAADPGLAVELESPPDATAALRTGRVAITVTAGDPVRFRFDPTRPDSRLARLAVAAALDRAAGRAPAYGSIDVPLTEPGSRYIDFLIPGLIGMTLMNAGMWGIGWSVVDARARKQLKRLAATPMRRSHYLLAFIFGHLVLIAGLLAALVVFARISFGVTVFGSYLTLALVTCVGGLCFAGMGVLVCSRTESNEVISGLNNAVMLPMFVTSGVFFSSATFPDAVQPIIRILPLTACNHALRRVMTDGAPIEALLVDLAILAFWGVACFLIGLRIFKWT